MVRYPNQYKIVINKEKVNQNDPERRYFLAYQETLEAAAQELTGNEFKLYIYLLSNKDKYEDLFSPDYFGKKYGVSADTARKLFHKLIEKGYLVKTAEHDVNFFDKPHKQRYSFKEEQRVDEDGRVLTFKEFYEEVRDYAPSEEAINAMWNTFTIMED